jgi:hypothetical protein
MTYLGFPTSDWRVWPRPTRDLEDDLCPECGQRRRATGDWVCARCRREIEEERQRWAIPHRAWYYDWTGELSNDPEGNICWLCDDCASELGDQVSHASEDDLNDSTCWRCGK